MYDGVAQTINSTGNQINHSNINYNQITTSLTGNGSTIIKHLEFEMPAIPMYGIHGRDSDMEIILDKLMAFNKVAICGTYGIGKTNLAVYCAKTWQKRFGSTAFIHVVFFHESLKRLATKLEINKEQVSIEIMKDIKTLCKDTKLLIILDDVFNFGYINGLCTMDLKESNLYFLATSTRTEADYFHCYYLPVLPYADQHNIFLAIINHNYSYDDDATKSLFLNKLGSVFTYAKGNLYDLTKAAQWVNKEMNIRIHFGKLKTKATSSYIALISEYLDQESDQQQNFAVQSESETPKSCCEEHFIKERTKYLIITIITVIIIPSAYALINHYY